MPAFRSLRPPLPLPPFRRLLRASILAAISFILSELITLVATARLPPLLLPLPLLFESRCISCCLRAPDERPPAPPPLPPTAPPAANVAVGPPRFGKVEEDETTSPASLGIVLRDGGRVRLDEEENPELPCCERPELLARAPKGLFIPTLDSGSDNAASVMDTGGRGTVKKPSGSPGFAVVAILVAAEDADNDEDDEDEDVVVVVVEDNNEKDDSACCWSPLLILSCKRLRSR